MISSFNYCISHLHATLINKFTTQSCWKNLGHKILQVEIQSKVSLMNNMWAALGKGTLRRKKKDIGSKSKSSEKFFLFPIFVFCRISLSDPYSTSMPNFKCRNNLKDPKRAVATFYSLSFSKYNKWGMGGVSKKKRHSFRLLHALYSLPCGSGLREKRKRSRDEE